MCAAPARDGIVSGKRDERPRILTALGQEIVGYRLGGGDGVECRGAFAVHFGQPRAAASPGSKPFQFVGLEHPLGGLEQVLVRERRGWRVLSHGSHLHLFTA
jgi:hypothetical protein